MICTEQGTKQRQIIQNQYGIGARATLRSGENSRRVVTRAEDLHWMLFRFTNIDEKLFCAIFFGRNVNQFSIKSLVCQMCDKYKIWQRLHSARISVIYFFKYIYV